MSSWKRTYWVVWLANLITSIGMMSFLPFFPSLLEEMGVQGEESLARWSGVCFAAAPLTATFSAPLWGALGDRIGRKIMVCRAMLAICLFVGGMAFAGSPTQLLILRCLQGCFSGFIPPSITLVSIAAPADRQGRIAGNLTTSLAIGGLFGPMLGGLAATWLGSHQRVFLAVGSLAGLAALLVWFGAEEDKSQRRASQGQSGLRGLWSTTRADLGEVMRNPVMRSTVFLVFALQFSLGAINPQLDLYVRDLLHGPQAESSWLARVVDWGGGEAGTMTLEERVQTLATSLLFGAMAVANLFSLTAWGIVGDRIGHRKALVHCALLCIVSLVAQGLATVYLVLLVGRLVLGVGMAGTGPLAFGLAAGEANSDRRGGAFGLVFSARTLAVAVGGTAGGLVYPWLGASGILLSSTGVLLVALGLFLRRQAPPASGAPGSKSDHMAAPSPKGSLPTGR